MGCPHNLRLRCATGPESRLCRLQAVGARKLPVAAARALTTETKEQPTEIKDLFGPAWQERRQILEVSSPCV